MYGYVDFYFSESNKFKLISGKSLGFVAMFFMICLSITLFCLLVLSTVVFSYCFLAPSNYLDIKENTKRIQNLLWFQSVLVIASLLCFVFIRVRIKFLLFDKEIVFFSVLTLIMSVFVLIISVVFLKKRKKISLMKRRKYHQRSSVSYYEKQQTSGDFILPFNIHDSPYPWGDISY